MGMSLKGVEHLPSPSLNHIDIILYVRDALSLDGGLDVIFMTKNL